MSFIFNFKIQNFHLLLLTMLQNNFIWLWIPNESGSGFILRPDDPFVSRRSSEWEGFHQIGQDQKHAHFSDILTRTSTKA